MMMIPEIQNITKIKACLRNKYYKGVDFSQHDELESKLKKIPHRNGIWGLEAIVILKKIRFRSPVEKNHRTSLLKVKSLNGRNFFNNK